jgi:hypothetical protein
MLLNYRDRGNGCFQHCIWPFTEMQIFIIMKCRFADLQLLKCRFALLKCRFALLKCCRFALLKCCRFALLECFRSPAAAATTATATATATTTTTTKTKTNTTTSTPTPTTTRGGAPLPPFHAHVCFKHQQTALQKHCQDDREVVSEQKKENYFARTNPVI